VSFPEIEKFDRLPDPRAEGPTAFVSIMEGCSKYCTYCVVPYTRGTEISRPFDDVLAQKIRRLRQVRPDIAISSDFIVGFPGESDQDHRLTMALIEEIGFDHSFSFIYSRRPGTPAADYPDDVPHEVKQARLAELQQAINTNAPCSPGVPRTTGW